MHQNCLSSSIMHWTIGPFTSAHCSVLSTCCAGMFPSTEILYSELFSWLFVIVFYMPFIVLGTILRSFGLSHLIPLYESYHGKGLNRIRQDAYDRFFTRIEQRFTKEEILKLKDSFSEVYISEKLPYWHFVCQR